MKLSPSILLSSGSNLYICNTKCSPARIKKIISADYGKFVTGIIDCSKPINTLVIKEGEEQPQLATVATPDLVYVINGERMPEGFDLNTIDPKTIASMEVLKTEKALQEYGTDKGVIIITTGEPKKNDDSKKGFRSLLNAFSFGLYLSIYP